MKAYFKLTSGYLLAADDDETADYLSKKTPGDLINASISICRNGKLHRKVMSMFNMIHDQITEPSPVNINGADVSPSHSMDSTRKYLTIMAGYYEIIGLPNGKVKYEAMSLSYDKMSEELFRKFYSDVIDAALKVMPKNWTDDQIKDFENQLIQYM